MEISVDDIYRRHQPEDRTKRAVEQDRRSQRQSCHLHRHVL